MKYYLASNNLYIDIKPFVLNQIKLQAEGEYPNENGGMLFGCYSQDKRTVYIEQILVPIEKVTSRTTFIRNINGLEKYFEHLSKDGLRYVGEWHSHPNGSTQYSSEDLSAMRDIENEVNIENPLLLIVGVTNEGANTHTFYCLKGNKLLKYREMVDLRNLFYGLQKQMQNSLNVNREFIEHPGSKGDATEHRWIEFLRTYLPDRYKVDKAIVIDSNGNVSDQMDVVIYDAIYTPFIFKQDGFMYIPAESVYAVFEVKQDVKGHIEYAAKKIESVRKLKRTSIGMVASGKYINARPLTKIIGGILTTTSSYADLNTIKKHLSELKGCQTMDLGCLCDTGSFYVDYNEIEPEGIDSQKNINDNRKYIECIYDSREVKEIKFSDMDVSLFTFFLQLVSYLKSIGTVPAIDVNAYLKAIDAKIDEEI